MRTKVEATIIALLKNVKVDLITSGLMGDRPISTLHKARTAIKKFKSLGFLLTNEKDYDKIPEFVKALYLEE